MGSIQNNGVTAWNGSPMSAYARPKPTSWEDQNYQNAQDEFNRQGGQAISDQNAARERRDKMGGAADAAMGALTSPQTLAMAGFQQTGRAPSAMDKWASSMPAYNSSYKAGANAMDSVNMITQGPNTSQLDKLSQSQPGWADFQTGVNGGSGGMGWGGGAGGGNAWDKFSTGKLGAFDAVGAGKKFAEGAYGDMSLKLGDELNTLQNKAAGAGRLRTGWLDRDKGQTVSRNVADFNNQLMKGTLDMNAQQLEALKAETGFEAQRATGTNDYNLGLLGEQNRVGIANAANATQAGIARNNYGLDLYKTNTGNALEMSKMGMDWNKSLNDLNLTRGKYTNDYNAQLGDQALRGDQQRNQFGLDLYGRNTQNALEQDRMGLDYLKAGDELRYNQARDTDRLNLDRQTTAAGQAISREGNYMNDYTNQSRNASDYASAALDRADWERQMKELKDEIARLRGGMQPTAAAAAPAPDSGYGAALAKQGFKNIKGSDATGWAAW